MRNERTMEVTKLAKALTAAIFDTDIQQVHRISLLTGNYPDVERSIGGFCRAAFESRMKSILNDYLSPEFVGTLLANLEEQHEIHAD